MSVQGADHAIPLTHGAEHEYGLKMYAIGLARGSGSRAMAVEETGIPYSTVSRLLAKFEEQGTVENAPRSGRPRILTDRGERLVVHTAQKNRRLPLQDISNMLPVKVSTSTIRRILDRSGYHRRVARKVPYLNASHRRCRRAWARKYRKWQAQWNHVIWSDETYIFLGDKAGRVYVTRKAGEELLEECLYPTFKQSPVRVMVWGCVMNGVKGPLVVLDYPGGKGGGMNATRYHDQVLSGPLLKFHDEIKSSMEKNGQTDQIYFQQDGASCHTAHATARWLEDQDIKTLYHPPQSPDLNPIERVWHELKRRVRALPTPPSTSEALKEAILKVWDELRDEDIIKHTSTMPERVKAIQQAHGGHTRY